MSNPRKSTPNQRLRHHLVSQWRGLPESPIIDLPAKNVSDVLDQVLKGLGLANRMQLEQVAAAWRMAAGDFIAKHSVPDGIAKGVLQVRVSQSSVLHALTMEKPVLLKKLGEALGKGVIKDVRFRHG